MVLDFSKLDLSMLDDAPDAVASQAGLPLELRLEEVEEDPDQPREEFEAESLEAFAAIIRTRGVQSPIGVRPKVNGVYRIVFGARRFRASKLAGMATIPAFIKADERLYDKYAQVIENTQREDLKPLELARFMQKRHDAGDSNKVIAERLGMRAKNVTHHMALLTAAAPILDAFREGRLTGAEQVYELQLLHEKDPDAVLQFLATPTDITTRTIRELGATINGEAQGAAAMPPADAGSTTDLSDTPTHRDSGDGDHTSTHERDRDPGDPDASSSSVDAQQLPFHNPDLEKEPKAPAFPDPMRLKKPLLLANYEDRAVMVLVFKRPSSPGLGFIKYEDGSGEVEVELGRLSNWTLTDSQV